MRARSCRSATTEWSSPAAKEPCGSCRCSPRERSAWQRPIGTAAAESPKGSVSSRENAPAVYLYAMREDDGVTRTAGRSSAVTEARAVAADVCADLRRGELLDSSFDRHATRLDPRDRRFTRELLYGMLRRRGWLDAVLEQRIKGGAVRLDADILDLLRLGAYQLLFMRSVPAYAAIAQTVELAKRRHGIGSSRLVNAVLRRLDREGDSPEVDTTADPIDALALVESHPI